MKKLYIRSLIALAMLVAPSIALAQDDVLEAAEPTIAKRYAGLDEIVAKAMAEDNVPGLSLAIVDGDTVIVRGYGVLKLGADRKVDGDTAFAYGSLAKPFIALGLNMLDAQGVLSVDDPIRDHIPEFSVAEPYVSAHATLRDALAHRTGVKKADIVWFADPRASFETVLERMHSLGQTHSFRGGFEYSNLMYGVAEHALARRSGMRADTFMDQRIFTPLGLERMTMDAAVLAGMDNVASPHAPVADGVTIMPAKSRSFGYQSASGPFFGSANDGAKWLRFLLGTAEPEALAIIPRAHLEDSWHRMTPIKDRGGFAQELVFDGSDEVSYAQGWFVSDVADNRALTHLGGADGMASLASFLPERGVGVVVLSNIAGSMSRVAIRNWVFARALGNVAASHSNHEISKLKDWNGRMRAALGGISKRWGEARMQSVKSPVPIGAYVGEYASPIGGTVTIMPAGQDGLVAKINSRPPVQLKHWHDTTFELIWELDNYNWPLQTLVDFDLDFQARPKSFLIDGGGETIVYQRKSAN